MVGNVTIFLKVVMKLLYYSLCLIPLNEGKTSRMAFPLIKKKYRSVPVGRGSKEEGDEEHLAGAARKKFSD